MDHYELPPEIEPFTIPFVCSEEYDGGDFFSYPKRRGWAEEDFRDPYNRHRSIAEIEAFAQEWLYFGFLLSVFSTVDIQVKSSDLVKLTANGEKVIYTAPLLAFFAEWRKTQRYKTAVKRYEAKHGSLKGIWRPEKKRRLSSWSKRGETIASIMRKVEETLCSGLFSGEIVPPGREKPLSVISKIGISIQLAMHPMMNVLNDLYGLTVDLRSSKDRFGDPSTIRRMVKLGWCPSEAKALISDRGFYSQFVFSHQPSPRWGIDHSSCNEQACHGKYIGGEYQTKHRTLGCRCDFISVPTASFEMVRQGRIPVISWRKSSDSEKFEIKVEEYDPESPRKYVAISHVWSDGLGNETSNSLPECQLSYLQYLVDELYTQPYKDNEWVWASGPTNPHIRSKTSKSLSSEERPIGFWMDTMCVPVHDNELRKLAIGQMRVIYVEAHRVLVLDSWMLRLSRNACVSEKASAVFLSNWQSRLWTLQEGLLAWNLFIQFKDGPELLSDLQKMKNKKQNKDLMTLKHLFGFVPFFDFHTAPGSKRISEDSFRLPSLARPLAQRSTTRKSDETICLATLLDINPEPLLRIRSEKKKEDIKTREEDLAEEQRVSDLRMAMFLRMIGNISPNIIFNTYPRIPQKGFQWAPRTYLGLHQAGAKFQGRIPESLSSAQVSTDGGLLLKCLGWRLKLPSLLSVTTSKFTVISRDKKVKYRILGDDGEPPMFPLLQPQACYALLSDRLLSEDCVAILAILESRKSPGSKEKELYEEQVGGWLKVTHLCRVKVHYCAVEDRINEGKNSTSVDEDHIDGYLLDERDETRKWCVM